MIDLDELYLNNDIQRFTERLMSEIESIQNKDDLIKLFRESVEYNEYDKITEVMLDGDYVESALNLGYGFKAIPYLKDYDLIENDIEAILESLDREDKIYQALEWVKDNFMECDFIKKFYPECKSVNYTPEDLFERAANLEEIGRRLVNKGILCLENKQEYIHELMGNRNIHELNNFNDILCDLKEAEKQCEDELEFER